MSKLRVKIDKLKDRIDVTKNLMKDDYKNNFKKQQKQQRRLKYFEKNYKKESNNFLLHHLADSNELLEGNKHLSAFVVF